MAGHFKYWTDAELEAGLAAASDWFERCGANVGPGRVGHYLRNLRELVAAFSTQDFAALKDRDSELMTAVYEAHDIVAIHRALGGGQYDSIIADRIRRISDGPISYTAENPHTSSNAARNFAFELLIAERLVRGGLTAAFPSNADVATDASGTCVAIQCKRLWSSDPAAVKRNFARAEKQLKDAKKAKACGVVALDISRAINPEFRVLSTRDANEVRRTMPGLLDSFFHKHSDIWSAAKGKTIGLILRVKVMAVQSDLSTYTHCQQTSVSVLPAASQTETQAVAQIAAAFDTALVSDPEKESGSLR